MPFSVATARCQIKIEVHISVATCQGPFHREPVPIKPHYFQGYHLLPNGVEIAAYLLVNNNKKRTHYGATLSRWKERRWQRKRADREPGRFSRDSFILWKGQAEGDLPL